MNKIIGYLLALLGLVGMFASSKAGQKVIPSIDKIPSNYILIPSLVLVGLGVVILIITGRNTGKVKQAEKEVPIYKGKKIVGYRVEE